jgi:ABC-type polysaccharide/polyol phosphate transport system ATPase subunit
LIDESLSIGADDFGRKWLAAPRNRVAPEHTAVLVSHSEAIIPQLGNKVPLIQRRRSTMSRPPEDVLAAFTAAATCAASEHAPMTGAT